MHPRRVARWFHPCAGVVADASAKADKAGEAGMSRGRQILFRIAFYIVAISTGVLFAKVLLVIAI